MSQTQLTTRPRGKAGGLLSPTHSIRARVALAFVLLGALILAIGLIGVRELPTIVGETTSYTQTEIRLAAGGFTAALLGMVGITYLVVDRTVITPLNHLQRSTSTLVARRRYDDPLTTERTDEIGQLTADIDELRTTLLAEAERTESLNKRLATVATEQVQTIRACRDGDLTTRMQTETEIPQFDAVAENFNPMMARMETLIQEVRRFGNAVVDASVSTADQLDADKEAIDATTDSLVHINRSAEDQQRQLRRTEGDLETLSADLTEIATEAEMLAARAARANKKGAQGEAAAEEVQSQLEHIDELATASASEVEQLNRVAENITDVLEFIEWTTDQINMLSVNARVRAKSAAEAHSEQFEVMAGQIGELATEMDEATDQIETLLLTVREQSQTVADEIDETTTAVEVGLEKTKESRDVLRTLRASIETTVADANHIDTVTDDHAAETEALVEQLTDVRQLSERTVTETRQVSASTNEQIVRTKAVETRIEALKSDVAELNQALEYFTTSETMVSHA